MGAQASLLNITLLCPVCFKILLARTTLTQYNTVTNFQFYVFDALMTSYIFSGGMELKPGVAYKHVRLYLFEQQLVVGAQAGDEVLGEAQERVEDLRGEMLFGRALKHVADHQKPSVLDHMLLNGV